MNTETQERVFQAEQDVMDAEGNLDNRLRKLRSLCDSYHVTVQMALGLQPLGQQALSTGLIVRPENWQSQIKTTLQEVEAARGQFNHALSVHAGVKRMRELEAVA